MSEKHTPGPWQSVTLFDVGYGRRIFAGDQYIAFVGDTDQLSPAHANARLIAAAPELLDALKDCVEDSEQAVSDYLQKYGFNYRPERLTAMSETVAKARAAIAKATGGDHA